MIPSTTTAIPIIEKTVEKLNHPVIGIRRQYTKKTKRKETTTTASIEIRAWEIPVVLLGGVVAYGLLTGAFNDIGSGKLKMDPKLLPFGIGAAIVPSVVKDWASKQQVGVQDSYQQGVWERIWQVFP